MHSKQVIHGVLLSDTMDLKTFYGLDFEDSVSDVRLYNPDEVENPDDIRFAICWLPSVKAFDPYPNLEMAMSVGAGVDALLSHPGLDGQTAICRVRDPHQADLMAGYAVHEVLHFERDFAKMSVSQAEKRWEPLPMRPPKELKVAVLGNGTMGAAVTKALSALGFSVSVACRRDPGKPINGVRYCAGPRGIAASVESANAVINVLPLTQETENVLNADLFAHLSVGAWLVQIGRGEHLHEEDFIAALTSGQLAGASLDVFRQEPLPEDHPFWDDKRLRITPHIASDSTPSVVAKQIFISARELLSGKALSLAVDRSQGY